MMIASTMLLLGGAMLLALAMQQGRSGLVYRRLRHVAVREAETASRRSLGLRQAVLGLGNALAGKGKSRAELENKLLLAGITWREAAPAFSLIRLALCAVAAGVGALWEPLLGASADAALGAGIFFILPGRWLDARATKRARLLRAELPVAIDVMCMVLESGAAIEQAMRFSASLDPHPAPAVQKVLRGFVLDLDRGVPYELSLVRFGERLGIEDGRYVVEVLRQSLLHGTEVLQPLKSLAQDLRDRRLSDARIAIGKATTQMTVVMVATLLPALVGLIGAPAVSAVLTTLRGMQ
ncbi:type II secretion system F family protein [Rhodovarius crocodyli]|uniref:Type II secretion system F family protein n=1 Tax=Rhodovarius crocodyli TaxID=1979269 RepID=A0A437M1J0_9PROT|nr:type II secretion system F family protein [Rhodovarius crocodyli]RVT91548.1 type II secretion system F family protein [Rhodovarius crocodyli]